ncbi:MAG: HEAT repeat domain-containing protein [Planctomycetes bacterium]|nr:HEAT repeat domain-containing protein [Planctomycetota bacterium]
MTPRHPSARLLVVAAAACLLPATTIAQEPAPASPPAAAEPHQVVLDDGEVLVGSIEEVTGTRAKVRLADGQVRMIDVRRITRTVRGDAVAFVAAKTVERPPSPTAAAAVRELRAGEEVPLPNLLQATDPLCVEVLGQLRELAGDSRRPVRVQAVRALTFAATVDALQAAFAAAEEDAALLDEIARCASTGSALAAIDGSGGLTALMRCLGSRDKNVRAGAAWIGVHLGAEAAVPVLRTFVRDGDHHLRESAAMALAEHGDDAGAAVLIDIARRNSSPAMAANRDADAATRDAVARACRRERLAAIELLGRLRCAKARAALQQVTKQRQADDEVRAAAAAALARIADADSGR